MKHCKKAILQKYKQNIQRIVLLFVISAVILFACVLNEDLRAGQDENEVVNPHWTGKNCGECHMEEYPHEHNHELNFGGDSVKLCNRCHATEFATAEIHPVGMIPSNEMNDNIPKEFPLKDEKVTCLTCHDAGPQMEKNMSARAINPKFLRGEHYDSLESFCFSCHKPEQHEKTNPHKQLDEQGRIIKKSCLFCHQILPDPALAENINDISFKSGLELYCINCHPQLKKGHPARADHLIRLPDSMKESLAIQSKQLHVDLSMDNGTIFCGTCHNPHEKGVIQREEAQKGAGERYFLRLDGGYQLCVVCHSDKQLTEKAEQVKQKKEQPVNNKNILSSHKPMQQNKCKYCHAITIENREKPRAIYLCFQKGCHNVNIIENEFVHEKTVLNNCYLCHRGHSSVHKKLQVKKEDILCRACHPLLRYKGPVASNKSDELTSEKKVAILDETTAIIEEQDRTASQDIDNEIHHKPEEPGTGKGHELLVEYIKTVQIPDGNECGFCHSPNHRLQIGQMDMETCAGCHMYVQNILSHSSEGYMNEHLTFEEKLCSECHDPHSAQHRYLLKSQQETDNNTAGINPKNATP